MTRDELEAAIWRHWPTRGPEAAGAVDAILEAADAYRAAGRPVIGVSRAAADRGAVPVHYAPGGRMSACGHVKKGAVKTRPDVTADPAAVTCMSCMGTHQYQQAVA